jgi:hypothetical protein
VACFHVAALSLRAMSAVRVLRRLRIDNPNTCGSSDPVPVAETRKEIMDMLSGWHEIQYAANKKPVVAKVTNEQGDCKQLKKGGLL